MDRSDPPPARVPIHLPRQKNAPGGDPSRHLPISSSTKYPGDSPSAWAAGAANATAAAPTSSSASSRGGRICPRGKEAGGRPVVWDLDWIVGISRVVGSNRIGSERLWGQAAGLESAVRNPAQPGPASNPMLEPTQAAAARPLATEAVRCASHHARIALPVLSVRIAPFVWEPGDRDRPIDPAFAPPSDQSIESRAKAGSAFQSIEPIQSQCLPLDQHGSRSSSRQSPGERKSP